MKCYADSSKIFVVKRNANYGIFNTNGKEILEVKYKSSRRNFENKKQSSSYSIKNF